MKEPFFKYLLLLAIVCLAAYACVKKTTYATIPEIEFQAFYPYPGDSADLQIKFTDGDGDIGVSESDTNKTFFYTYYYKDTVTQQYRAYTACQTGCDSLRTGYIIKSPDDSYKGKPISGEMNVRLQKSRHSRKIKNVKYVFYLVDQAGNKSNVITTPEIFIE